MAGTQQTAELAAAPARCGQQAHEWVDEQSLGQIVARDRTSEYTADLLTALAELEGMSLPRPAVYDVVVQTVEYRTQNRGAMVLATAAVAMPTGLPEDAPVLDTILLLHGTMGFRDGCSASTDPGMQLLATLLSTSGYVVVVPDYLGLKAFGDPSGLPHPYLVGQATALDAVRAAGSMTRDEREGACMSPRFVAFGGSQGGHAALWVDRLAPYYAPELTLVGAIAAVPPTDLMGHTEQALTTRVLGTDTVTAALATASDWYDFADRLDELFVSPYDVDVPLSLATSCDSAGIFEQLEAVPIEDVFTASLLQAAAQGRLAELGPFGCFVAENGVTSTSIPRITPSDPAYGVLFVLGEQDELLDNAIERQAFDTLCAQGMPLAYLECAGAGHSDAVI